MNHLKRNLVNASIETLISEPNPHPKYVAESQEGNAISDAIVAALAPAVGSRGGGEVKADNYKAVIQGLFESGFLSTDDSDFSFDQLMSYSIGIKMYHALDAFNELFDKLTAGGFTHPIDDYKQYNSSGDNYYSAMSFDTKASNTQILASQITDRCANTDNIKDNTDDQSRIAEELEAEATQRKVIFVENQSPSWCYVLEYSIFTDEPQELYIVRLKSDYDDPDMRQAVIDMGGDFTDRTQHQFSPYNDKQVHRIIAQLDINNMECKTGWWEPKQILHSLFNIYSGRDSISHDE